MEAGYMATTQVTQEEIAALQNTFATNCCTIASLALYVYDRTTSIGQEVEVVWLRRKSYVIVLYTCMHLFAFASMFIATLLALYSGPCEVHHPDKVTDRYTDPVHTPYTFSTLLLEEHVITALRALAIDGRERRIPLLIVLLSI
ncbi:uncharacterized protein B0H18DRAFT_1100842 [Fomitopsis serialis]|uniref:uncharacterized protein n=1 Tax=Fomitopsis serialis TaxID=139415 RepID=UPI002008A468|nr:uncharacterized protein B0H18DRAFT_1100842 [Neoantrodia serialis]KAH9936135.1 hypothetical protein B0H18DRAFT_1100842 [Neoantrodia serialis]